MVGVLPDEVPEAVRRLVAGREHRLVWRNMLGGLTFAVDGGRRYLKWAPAGSTIDLAVEAERLRWAAPFTTVPPVLAHGADAHGSWLLTTGLTGDNAVNDRWIGEPATAVAAIGRGLHDLHGELPVAGCPFSWSVQHRLDGVRRLAEAGRLDPAGWHEEYRELSVPDVLAALADPPPEEIVVVCHGDACAPNTLLDEHGRCCGHVDLGSLGVADRWADLAVATWSATWNYGPGREDALLEAYGIDRDDERIAYYRLLWDAAPD